MGPHLPGRGAGGGGGWLCVSVWFRSDVRSQAGLQKGKCLMDDSKWWGWFPSPFLSGFGVVCLAVPG